MTRIWSSWSIVHDVSLRDVDSRPPHADFVSQEELHAQWRIFSPVLQELVEKKVEPAKYAYGSRGPSAADSLARRYGMTKFGGGLTPYVNMGELLAAKDDVDLERDLGGSDANATAA